MGTKANEIGAKVQYLYDEGPAENLMRFVNAEALLAEHQRQERRKATGIDGINKDRYNAELDRNIQSLVERMKGFRYRPQPVRRTYIPKANGKMRPLGIPAYEDRLVQGVMSKLLDEVYEVRFLDCSYGFRKGRSCHDVVRYLNDTIMGKKVNFVLEADIKGFFDNVDHGWLMKFLEYDIHDKNFRRYIGRFLKAGIMEGTAIRDSDKGTPQGGLISPVLANVYLHYVLDLWVERVIKPKARGEVYYVRYADDFVLLFQYKNEAEAAMAAIRQRLKKFSLEVAEDKTRILPFGRFAKERESFDFLGFTFFNTTTRTNKYRVGIRTSKKKLVAKKQAAKAWLRERRNKPVPETMKLINAILRGHCNYYGVSGNYVQLSKFHEFMRIATWKMLCSRSQKGHIPIAKFQRTWKYFITPPRIVVNIWK